MGCGAWSHLVVAQFLLDFSVITIGKMVNIIGKMVNIIGLLCVLECMVWGI